MVDALDVPADAQPPEPQTATVQPVAAPAAVAHPAAAPTTVAQPADVQPAAVQPAGAQTAVAPPPPVPSREPITMKSLLEAGVHFGHQTRRWNPQMKRYIFTQRNGIHIIDLQQTLGMIHDASRAMTQLVAEGGKVLFVGTKRQAQEVVQSEADRCGMWYVNQRWLGGTLTNFQTLKTRIAYMLELQQKRDQGYFRVLPKKEGVKLRDTLARLEKYFTGLRNMTELPKALFVIDIGKEDLCIAEARRMGIAIFAIIDSDCDPGKVTHSIPGNDDAVRSIRLITGRMANAALEGQAQREAMLEAERAELALAEHEAQMLSEQEEAALAEAAVALAQNDDATGDSDLPQVFSEEDFTAPREVEDSGAAEEPTSPEASS